ncbi:hypothetical protein ACRZ5S_14900 [Vibrio scophthalmi]|uniref:hypothetical protein n=1 Tax=Vibrio scophthalmi TaxID=45658 RepID=UPI003EBD242D
MKKIAIAFALFYSAFSYADVLETQNYTISIEINCEQGEMLCKDVSYLGVSKKSQNQIQLKGETVHTICADGVTPCTFLGYRFQNGTVDYFVSVHGDLRVTNTSGDTLLHESGEWRD